MENVTVVRKIEFGRTTRWPYGLSVRLGSLM